MTDRLLVATRKGLFDARCKDGAWTPGAPSLRGLPVPYAGRDPRDGRIWASLDHGHWGVKLARSEDDGETLAFGTASGNLYVSEDGGERWEVVAHNLPAVYSVRFA